MSHTYSVELTDTLGGEANYSWVKRATVTMPDLTHYGYDSFSNYAKANRTFQRELMRKAKAAVGLTGVRGVKCGHNDYFDFRPHRACMVMFINYQE